MINPRSLGWTSLIRGYSNSQMRQSGHGCKGISPMQRLTVSFINLQRIALCMRPILVSRSEEHGAV